MSATTFIMNTPFGQSALSYGSDASSISSPSSYSAFLNTPEIPASITPGLRDLSPFNEQTDAYVQYYFEHVRKLQFVLAGKDLTHTLSFVSASSHPIFHDITEKPTHTQSQILSTDPQGPLEYAICALASLHLSKANAAQGFDASAESPEHMIDRRFYKRGHNLLMTAKASGRPFTEADAVGAVFLISYHNLAGGGTGWIALLEVAYDWFSQTGIHEEQNPKLALMNMTAPQKLAAKATMVRSPRFGPVSLFAGC